MADQQQHLLQQQQRQQRKTEFLNFVQSKDKETVQKALGYIPDFANLYGHKWVQEHLFGHEGGEAVKALITDYFSTGPVSKTVMLGQYISYAVKKFGFQDDIGAFTQKYQELNKDLPNNGHGAWYWLGLFPELKVDVRNAIAQLRGGNEESEFYRLSFLLIHANLLSSQHIISLSVLCSCTGSGDGAGAAAPALRWTNRHPS